jgi:hypothetical protein
MLSPLPALATTWFTPMKRYTAFAVSKKCP